MCLPFADTYKLAANNKAPIFSENIFAGAELRLSITIVCLLYKFYCNKSGHLFIFVHVDVEKYSGLLDENALTIFRAVFK